MSLIFPPDSIEQFEKTLSDLVSIKSLSGEEAPMADYIQKFLSDCGLKMERDDQDNVWTVLEPSVPGDPRHNTLHLNGHTDTVPPVEGWKTDPWKPEIVGKGDERRLVGLGSTDMKSGLTTILYLAKYFSKHPLKRLRLVVSFTICEEGPVPGKQNGVVRLVERHAGRWALTTEPGSEPTHPTITLGCQGHAVIKLILRGCSAHSSTPELGMNAIHAAGKISTRVKELNDSYPPIPLLDGIQAKAAIAVTMIKGGSAPNIIPEQCEMSISRRLVPGETLKTVEEELKGFVRDLDGVAVSWTVIGGVPACQAKKDGPLLECATEASRTIFGKVTYTWLRGRGDLVVFSQAGMDVLNIGPGTKDQAHVAGEYARTVDLPRSANLIAETIQRLDQWLVANPQGK